MKEKPWADEPTSLCDQAEVLSWDADDTLVISTDRGAARDLERKLRHANALIGKLRADTDCGDFDKDDLEQWLADIEEVLTL
jgi:hypothetical protein